MELKFRTLLFLGILTLNLSCARELEPEIDNRPIDRITVSLDVDSSKISVTQGSGKLSLRWEATDTLRVIGNTSEPYLIEKGFTEHSASFSGPYVEGNSFSVLYPGKYESEEAIMARSFLGQVQHGNGSTAHLEYNAIARELTDYHSVSFSKSTPGVQLTGAAKFVVKMPADAGKLSSISIKAGSEVFYKTNGTDQRTGTLTLALEDCDVSKSGQILTAYMMTSWQPFNLMKGSELTIRVTCEDKPCYYEHVVTTGKTYKYFGGECFVLDLSSKPMIHKITGSGTISDPYAIFDADDMSMFPSLAKSGKTTYFQLCADVDMKDVAWTPAFTYSGHGCAIQFNGGGHVLKNLNVEAAVCPSIFGELNGKVSDLTIEDPVVKGTDDDCGVVCGRLGSSVTSGEIKNVKVVNPSVTAVLNGTSSGAGVIVGNLLNGTVENITVKHGKLAASGSSLVASVGGVIGQTANIGVRNAVVDSLSIDNQINNTKTSYSEASSTGGVVGKISDVASIDNCSFVGGSITALSGNENFIGGILGLSTVGVTVSRCRSEFNLKARSDIGGIVGYLRSGSIYKCSFKGDLSGREAIGGIVGWVGERSSVNDCFSEGTYTNNHQVMGGIAGDVMKNTSVSSCYSTAKLVGGRAVGGVVGRLANGGWTAAGTNHGNSIKYCIAWNVSISATGTTSQAGSGAVIGYTGTKNSFDYCYRKYNFSFSCSACPSGVQPLINHDRSTSEITAGISEPYWYPYHAHDVSSTDYPDVTSVVKYINTKISGAWDTNIWNLDGAYPSLKEVGGSGGAGGDTPAPKPGINPGSDWTKNSVADGIDYYYFHKTDAITGKIQSVHVTAVDMNSGKWALKLYYDGNKRIDSYVFAQTKAYVSINGGYERPSIVVKQDGVSYYNINNDEIGDTGIKNWKNEGAICFNEGTLSDITLSAAGFGKDLAYQRQVYVAMPQPNIISSAPVLIRNYEQVGTSFCSRYAGSYWGSTSNHEHPASHQSGAYPRTAIGMTHDGYLLLVVVDGRFSGKAVGMGASELTKFMVKYFNPKDLLNFDGGGSSTMCVKGYGDSSTHVVSYPCDDGSFTHAGEREVPTHFYIVPSK